jgi:hypothetical protein
MSKMFSRFTVLLFSFSLFSFLHSGLIRDSLVKTGLNSCKKVQDLRPGDEVLGIKIDHGYEEFSKRKIKEIVTIYVTSITKIETDFGVLYIGNKDKLYNPDKNKCVVAEELMPGDALLDIELNPLIIRDVEVIELDAPIELFLFLIQRPHLFFVCDSGGNSIVVHNLFGLASIGAFISSLLSMSMVMFVL